MGGSQNRDAINSEVMTTPSFNIGTSSQGYFINSRFLEYLRPKLPKLKTVIIPITYRHFEMGPPQYNSWRNNTYRYYFDLDINDDFTYFKDKLLFLSNPEVYDAIVTNYKKQKYSNPEGALYNYNVENSLFYKLNYDLDKIKKQKIKSPQKPSASNLRAHAYHLNKILKYCQEYNLEVVFSITPVTDSYSKKQNHLIKKNRDSILSKMLIDYDVEVFCPNMEEFSLLEDYRDHNHLGPKGANKYTKSIEIFLDSISKR